MSLPEWLRVLLPEDTGAAWEEVAPVVPAGAYLGGGTAVAIHLRHRESRDLDFFTHEPFDSDSLTRSLRTRGPFAVTESAAGTLTGVYGETRLQFLQAGITRPEHRIEPTKRIAGIDVAGLGDLLAMKLNAIAGRGELRDYFDVMAIEEKGGRTVEEGLALFMARYRPVHADSAVAPIVLALGYLDDIVDDPSLPVSRDEIARYWQRRQPQIAAAIERFGIPEPRR